jgi:uncharacterized membrane protein YecN with MAPEG domain
LPQGFKLPLELEKVPTAEIMVLTSTRIHFGNGSENAARALNDATANHTSLLPLQVIIVASLQTLGIQTYHY